MHNYGHLNDVSVGDIAPSVAGHEVGVSCVGAAVTVGMCGGELHAGRIHRPLGPNAFPRVQVQREAVHLAGGHRGVGEASFVCTVGHVKLGREADCVEGDDVIAYLLRHAIVEDLCACVYL